MKILLACLTRDYREPDRERSYEYYNLYLPLSDVANEVLLFDFQEEASIRGKKGMNQVLEDLVQREKPDYALFALYQNDFEPSVLERLRNHTTTVAYFFDDDWRRSYTQQWIPHFDFFTTPRHSTYQKYIAAGHSKVVCSPFGYNPEIFRPQKLQKEIDVSFVGGFHPWRQYILDRIRAAGVRAEGYGPGWPSGMLTQEELIRNINSSKINLNLSNSTQWNARYLLSSPKNFVSTLRSRKTCEQVKGRHFELAGCGAFQLCPFVQDLEKHFDLGKELIAFKSVAELIQQIRYYLEHSEEASMIAANALTRATREHTAQLRLQSLFSELGQRVARRVRLRTT